MHILLVGEIIAVVTDCFSYVKYCDLGIATLRIFSKSTWESEMICFSNQINSTFPVINLYLVEKNHPVFHCCTGYREKHMRTGHYIGHHFGKPVYLHWENEENIFLACDNPGKIIWCYIIKVVLTLYAQKHKILHIKGSTLEYNGKSFVILGRGESGKTEFVQAICNHGGRLMGNTHALIDGDLAFGIKSNIRIRKKDSEHYLSINDQIGLPLYHTWAPIGALIWIKYRTDNAVHIQKMPYEVAYQNMRWFSEAIGNWEIKEDIADFINSDPFDFSIYMESIDKLVEKLCKYHSSFYMNLNIKSSEGLNRVLKLLNDVYSL